MALAAGSASPQDRGAFSTIRSRPLVGVGVAVAALIAIVHPLRVFQTVVSDDAYILFRYARHLAAGHGLVWNAGEPPIEGFTSLLAVVLMALATRAGIDLVTFSQILGIGGSVLVCLATAWLAHEVSAGDARSTVAAAIAVALAPPLAAWARGGLETTLFTALLAGALACWLTQVRSGTGRHASSALFLVAFLTRPEALLVAAVAVIADLFPARGVTWSPRATARAGARWWPLATGLLAGC